MAEIQKALSDSHLSIYDEKNTVSSLKLEYEDLLKTERADIKRIRELEALNEDVAAKAKMPPGFKDCRPLSTQKNIPLSKKERAIKRTADGVGSDANTMKSTISQKS